MPTPWQRDLEKDRKYLTEWLGGKLPDASDVTVSELRSPESSGFSNDTLLFDLTYRQDGDAHSEPLVVRIQPTGFHGHPLWRDVRYSYQHKDYDGPEDDRCGNAPTVEDCIEEIDEYEAEKDSSS